MGIEVAIVVALGFTAGSTAATVAAGIITAVATTLVSTGISLVTRQLLGKDRGTQRSPTPADVPVRQVIKQATPRQRYVYGRALVGGAICFYEKKPPYIIVSYLIAAHRCDAVEAVYIDGTLCEFSGNGLARTQRFRSGGVPYLEISTRLGDPDQPICPLIASEFPDVPTTFRQRGHTVVTLKAYYGVDFDDHEETWGQSGGFQPLFLVRGKPVYDPRDSAQDRDDEITWRWSDNWALCLTDWIRAPYGARKKAAQIDYTAVAAEADLCDRSVGLAKGGTEARYTLNGGLQSDESPFGKLDEMLNAAGEAAALWRRGMFAPLCDVRRDVVRTLTQEDTSGPITFRGQRPRNSTLNTVRSEFIFPDRQWKAAQTPPIVDEGLLASDGQPLEATISRPFVAGEERAQRLDNITLLRSRLGRELRLQVGVEHLALEVGDLVNIELKDFSFANDVYAIRATAFDEALQKIELTLEQAPSTAVHQWTTDQVQSTDLIDIIEAA